MPNEVTEFENTYIMNYIDKKCIELVNKEKEETTNKEVLL